MRKPIVGAALLVVLAGASALSYWAGTRSGAPASGGAAPGKSAPAGPPPVAVEMARVAVVKLPQAIAAVGSLRSDETIVVRPEIAGRVAQIAFREGERVAAGEVLVRLDESVQRADLARAEANFVLSKSKFERAVDLRNKGFISSQAKDEAENTLRVAEADAELMRARFAKTEIRAPFHGIIGLRQVSVGDYVKEGQDIVNLEAIDPLKVDFRVPEVFLTQVRGGQTLQITLDAIPDRTYAGQVYAINPLVDANGRSLVVRARVPNVDARLRPGMFARVQLLTTAVRDTLVIPEESLFPVGDDKYVYKIVDGRAMRQKVEIGQRRDGRVEILAGLAAAEPVVTAGQLKLRDGAAVKVAGEPPEAPPPVGKASVNPAPGSRS